MERFRANTQSRSTGPNFYRAEPCLGAAKWLVRHIPLPERMRVWLRHVGRRLLVPNPVAPARLTSALGHPIAGEERNYAVWALHQIIDEHALRARVMALDPKPLISVIVPVHDPELAHLQCALESVDAQVYPHWELCIVDDGSTNPRVPAFLERYAENRSNVRYIRLDPRSTLRAPPMPRSPEPAVNSSPSSTMTTS